MDQMTPTDPAGSLASTALVPSPVDHRDVLASDILGGTAAARPDSLTCPYPLSVKDQFLPSYVPDCVGQAGSTMKEFDDRIPFDGLELYRQCKLIDGIPDVQGTYFRAVLSVLKNTGALALGDASGARRRIDGYVRVEPDAESIRQAIWKWGTVLMAFNIYSNGSWQTAYIKVPAGSKVVAGHATVGKGYDARYVRGQNCWGTGWGDKGDFYVPSDYLPYECWAITDVPAPLLPDPAKKPRHVFSSDLYQGLNNGEVKALQDCLVWFGCMTAAQEATGPGNFGPRTREAVKLFQERYGLPDTGYFGPLSRDKMSSLLAR